MDRELLSVAERMYVVESGFGRFGLLELMRLSLG